MKSRKEKKSALPWWLIVLIAGMILAVLAFVIPTSPAAANPPAQDGYPVETLTPTITVTVTATVTATRSGTLPVPANTGTATQIIPVTGADLTRDPPNSNVGMWIALWLVGLLLVGFGANARLRKR